MSVIRNSLRTRVVRGTSRQPIAMLVSAAVAAARRPQMLFRPGVGLTSKPVSGEQSRTACDTRPTATR